MIHRVLASKLFEAFSISRWNDRIRPIELTEMDKQALKSVLTYFMGMMEEKAGKVVDWEYIVCGNVFGLLSNIALSDIKAPIISELKKEHPKEYNDLNKWVVEQYKTYIEDKALLDRFAAFLAETGDAHPLECKILRAAHKYSTKREFDIIKPANELAFPIHQIEFDLQRNLADFTDLRAAALLNTGGELNQLICIIEQLRCQTRWSQTPRIPKTSVLGHCMYVAALAFFLSWESGACPKMLVNNFYTALFHDLPESVTRDIISPVKRATESLPIVIKEIEHKVCVEELYPKVPEDILPDLCYLLGDVSSDMSDGHPDEGEFANRFRANGKVTYLNNDVDMSLYNDDRFDPINGTLIKVCDEIAAFMEAYKSIEYGVSTYHLQDGLTYVRSKYSQNPIVQNLNVGQFFAEFN